jgi:hypothetical protein
MRFTLPALLVLILTRHQALALPATPTQITGIERKTTASNGTLQAVARVGAGLGTLSEPTWSSTPLQLRLLFDLPVPIANGMKIINTKAAWKLLFTYTGDAAGNGNADVSVIPDGTQSSAEIQICIYSPAIFRNAGTTGDNSWVEAEIFTEVVWWNTVSQQLVSVFWAATYQFGENDPDLTLQLV